MPSPEPPDPRVGLQIGGCRVERLLGRGGMGSVYLARQVHLARPVALKVLDEDHAEDEVYRARFLLEARIAARVEHENVVGIYDAGEDAGALYLVLQLVPGGDLASYAQSRRIEAKEVAKIGLQIARALDAAWAEGIVHLDVKPANVLRSEREHWKVADFGIARRVAGRHDPDLFDESAVDDPGTVSGSPPYMPPEQWQGQGVDGRTDLYALGVTLYQLLTGRLPIVPDGKGGGLAWYRAHVAGPRLPLAIAAPGVPASLVRLVDALLARDPAGRPASAAEVVDSLAEMIAAGLADPARGGAVAPPPPLPASRTPPPLPASRTPTISLPRARPSGADLPPVAELLAQAPRRETPPLAPTQHLEREAPASLGDSGVRKDTTPGRPTFVDSGDPSTPDAVRASYAQGERGNVTRADESPVARQTGKRRDSGERGLATPREGSNRVRTVFIGRRAEREAVAGALAAAREGRGALFVLEGPPGVGRTRLLHEVAVAASASANVLRGRGSLESPLHAVRHILRGLFDLERSGTADELRGRLAHGLARIVAAGAGVVRLRLALEALLLGGADTAAGVARDVPVSTLAALVRARATRQAPVLVAIDQLEEADRPTLEMLAALASMAATSPLVVVAAVKHGELGDLAVAALSGAASGVRRLSVGPLAGPEIAAVASTALGGPPRPPLPPALVAALVGPAEGLPKVVVGAAREAFAHGTIRPAGPGALTGDAAALRALAERAARLVAMRAPRPSGRLGTGAHGRAPSASGSGPMLAIDPAAEAAALASLAGGTPPAPALETAALADSASRAIDRFLTQGMRLRDFHDLPGATKQLELALSRVGPRTHPAAAARVRLELARTLRAAGTRLAEAAALAARAMEQAEEAGERTLGVEAALERGLALYLDRRYEPGILILDEGAALLAAARAAHAALPQAQAAQGEAALFHDRARRLACEVEHARALVLDRIGGEANARAATDAYWSALRSAGAAGDADLFGRTCQSLGESRRRAGDDRGAEGYLELSARYKERLGDLAGLAIAYGSLARLARDRGQREKAADLFRRDLAIALTIGDHRGAGVAANSLGELMEERWLEAADEGALAAAEEAYGEARRAAARTANPLDDAISCYYTGRFLCRSLARRDPAARETGLSALDRSRGILASLGKAELVAKVDAAVAAAQRREGG